MKFAFDLDGVVMNTQNILFNILEANYNFDRRRQNQHRIIIPSLSYGETENVIFNILMENTKHIKPLDLSISYLKIIHKRLELNDEPLIFMTARNELLKEVTDKWVEDWIDIPSAVLYVPNSKKSKMAEKLGITHFVEDRFRNAQEISEVCNYVYLVNQRWNKGRIPKHNVKRIPDLSWIIDDIELKEFFINYESEKIKDGI